MTEENKAVEQDIEPAYAVQLALLTLWRKHPEIHWLRDAHGKDMYQLDVAASLTYLESKYGLDTAISLIASLEGVGCLDWYVKRAHNNLQATVHILTGMVAKNIIDESQAAMFIGEVLETLIKHLDMIDVEENDERGSKEDMVTNIVVQFANVCFKMIPKTWEVFKATGVASEEATTWLEQLFPDILHTGLYANNKWAVAEFFANIDALEPVLLTQNWGDLAILAIAHPHYVNASNKLAQKLANPEVEDEALREGVRQVLGTQRDGLVAGIKLLQVTNNNAIVLDEFNKGLKEQQDYIEANGLDTAYIDAVRSIGGLE